MLNLARGGSVLREGNRCLGVTDFGSSKLRVEIASPLRLPELLTETTKVLPRYTPRARRGHRKARAESLRVKNTIARGDVTILGVPQKKKTKNKFRGAPRTRKKIPIIRHGSTRRL